VLGIVIGLFAGWVIFRKILGGDRVGKEEEGKVEAGAGVVSQPDEVAAEPSAIGDNPDSGSDSGGDGEPQVALLPGLDSSSGGGKPSKSGSEPLDKAQSVRAKQAAGTDVIECEEVRVISAVAERTSIVIPFDQKLRARRQFRAHFDPEVDGLWVSADKGSIEPGALEYPFALFFEPKEAGVFETTLIVSLGEFETHVPIVASTQGGARRHRHHRSK
jgi:hypothetical protein